MENYSNQNILPTRIVFPFEEELLYQTTEFKWGLRYGRDEKCPSNNASVKRWFFDKNKMVAFADFLEKNRA